MADLVNDTTPRTLGRYELLVPVARGGMGQVWAGRLRGARGFNKLVAIKTLLPLAGAEGRLESMLLEEARIAALIHHPNVVQTIELGEHEGTLYLVMEWVDGEPLSFLMSRAEEKDGIPREVAVNLVGQMLLGLHAAHELADDAGAPLGVVHRDVSPHNVLVTYSGVAKLVDFGIAKATNSDSSSTQTGEVKGKFSYMAPEQVRSEAVDRRADVFAAGIMLYTLTTGRHPFKSENPAGLVHKLANDDPAPRAELTDAPALEAVIMKALEKEPDARFGSAQEMLEALSQAEPAAFVTGFENQVRDYLSGLLGDRATRRRDVLRRAQLAADARAPSGSLPAVAGPSQSASSLRALSIDQSDAPPPEIIGGPTELRGGRKWRGLLGAAIALLTVVGLTHIANRTRHATEASSAAAAPTTPTPPLASIAPVAPHGQPAATAVASAAPSEAAPTPSTAVSAPNPAPAHSGPPAARPRVQRKRNGDLIAPDYAR